MRLRIYLVLIEIMLIGAMFRLMLATGSYWCLGIMGLIIGMDFIIVAVFNHHFSKVDKKKENL